MKGSDDPKIIAALAEALANRHRKVKEAALQALADKKGENVTQILRGAAGDTPLN